MTMNSLGMNPSHNQSFGSIAVIGKGAKEIFEKSPEGVVKAFVKKCNEQPGYGIAKVVKNIDVPGYTILGRGKIPQIALPKDANLADLDAGVEKMRANGSLIDQTI